MIVRYSKFGQPDERIIPAVATATGAMESLAQRSIWPGVATGVLVYVTTRLIDRWIFAGGK